MLFRMEAEFMFIGKIYLLCVIVFYSWAGVSRSSTICIAFLMNVMEMTLESSMLLVRKARR